MPDSDMSANHSLLRRFLEAESEAMLKTLRFYLLRSGLAGEQAVGLAAVELLNEVTVEALEHADRFRPSGQPRAWLLGIAANLIKRKQSERARLMRKEPLVRDLNPGQEGVLSEDELFDRLLSWGQESPEGIVQREQDLEKRLAGLSQSDRQVIQLAVLGGMNGEEVARELGVPAGTARVRLHRALRRLRKAWQEQAPEEANGYG
jgi:RNA polymerase sigma factor (sigma-70 family)